jgi:hypothetical protein
VRACARDAARATAQSPRRSHGASCAAAAAGSPRRRFATPVRRAAGSPPRRFAAPPVRHPAGLPRRQIAVAAAHRRLTAPAPFAPTRTRTRARTRRNPFYRNERKTIEPHLLHAFERDFYDEELRLVVTGYLRPEKNYPSLDALIAAIHADIKTADEQLGGAPHAAQRAHAALAPGGGAAPDAGGEAPR